MKKLMRLLALTLAAAMLLSVGALAAENESGGPRLVWSWVDWDEEGAFVNDDRLSGREYGDEELHMAIGDDYCGIFFLTGEDGKRTPVIPKAGGGVTIEQMEKEEISSGAKQSQYYVHVRKTDWKDAEITSGKATMKVVGELPQVGFYTAAEATQNGYLRNDQQPCDLSQLPDKTAYFIATATDEDHGRHITNVKKGSDGNPSMYDLEKVSDSVWKIVMKAEDGGVGVNLVFSWLDTSGSAYDEETGYWFEYPRGPELWKEWLTWEEDPQPESEPHGGNIDVVPVTEEYHLAFYTCEEDGKKLTPVPVDQLKADKGVTITPLVPGDAKKSHYAIVSVDGWGDYTISYNGYSLTLKSHLPEFGLYSQPKVSTDNFMSKLRYNPANPNDVVYVGACLPEGDERTLASVEFADFENRSQYTLERYNDDFYKLTRKSVNVPDGDINFNVTWKWPDGQTETRTEGVWSERWPNALVSEKPIAGLPTLEEMVSYDGIKSQLSDKVTLKTGESKTIYLAATYFIEDEWVAYGLHPLMFSTSSSALKLTFAGDGKDVTKYTLSCDVPGVYTIGIYGIDFTILDAKGNDISDTFEYGLDYDFEAGEWIVVEWDEATESAVPVDLDEEFTITCKSGEDRGWYPVTVTVTGDAANKPTETPTGFPDVKSTAWYASAVAFASANGYMNGNADGTFNPDGQVKGSEFAQILHNKEGKPAAADGAAFNGVTDQWYASAILWAAGKGIVTDTGDTAVAPTANLTRQQIALMLYNYMGKPAADADLSKFSDADKISGWALDAVKWAVSEGILKGNADGTFNPTGTAKRSETAQILMNFFG